MKRKITVIVIVLAILVGAFLLMSVLSSLNPDHETPPAPVSKAHVKVKKVIYSNIESQVLASGRIVAQNSVDVASEVQGVILSGSVPLKKGQTFKKDDLLLQVYSKEFELSLQAQKSRLLTSIANILPDFKIDYPESYKAWSDFFDNIKIDEDMPNLPELKSRKEKIYLASRNILSDYYSIKGNEIRLDKYFIRALFDGVYIQVNSEVGSVANPGSPLAKIIRTDQLELEVPVKAEEIRWLHKGDKVIASTQDGLSSWKGKISRISKFVDPTTQSISVFVQLPFDPQKTMYNGQYLKAVFPGKIVQSGMEIPRNAMFNFNEVFTVEEGKLKKHEINIEKFNQNTVIINGLPEGVDVVSEPLINAIENTEVEVFRERPQSAVSSRL